MAAAAAVDCRSRVDRLRAIATGIAAFAADDVYVVADVNVDGDDEFVVVEVADLAHHWMLMSYTYLARNSSP